ncbi:E3 SUMO- ligase KIAA1586-like [Paramuricea clavata]|uniref:E3 SUMO- ligase KIAA1586-like n=1 Tax=Paramuricea clavata TaxID=317549 RepID=A0A7D9HCL6_PARCT|nr:E3 SUMO- ligase KIAA1586-like [Paramuricea clavata]CAB4004219.1 E3 SUMO- ligase KIAA1586-like [Paramuricea clavata]
MPLLAAKPCFRGMQNPKSTKGQNRNLGHQVKNKKISFNVFVGKRGIACTRKWSKAGYVPSLQNTIINGLLLKSTAPVNTSEVEDLVQKLRETYFSISPDEMTDVTTEKQLGICVVYFDQQRVQPVSRFFDMVEVEQATAAGLYGVIKSLFEEKKIPITNIVGYSSDNTNVMFGENQSVVALLKKDAPYVFAMKCSCHMIHMCASYACLKMSMTLEDLCRNIYSYFSRSSLRQKEFQEFQEFVKAEPHKLLGIGQTRWLSLEACVRRVLEQWDALRLFFTSVVNETKDPSYTTESILKGLSNKYS